MENPREPEAFQKKSPSDRYMMNLVKLALFGIVLLILSKSTHILQKFTEKNFKEKNSVRFSCIMLIGFLICAVFLIIKTPRGGDLAQNMIDHYPIAAYSMAACLVILLLTTFNIFTELIGPLGIIYFVAFWGFVINLMLVSPI